MISLATQANLAKAKSHSTQENKISQARGEHDNAASDAAFSALATQHQAETCEVPKKPTSLITEQMITPQQGEALDGNEGQNPELADNLLAMQAAASLDVTVETQALPSTMFSLGNQRLAGSQQRALNASAALASLPAQNIGTISFGTTNNNAVAAVGTETSAHSLNQIMSELMNQPTQKPVDAAPVNPLAYMQITPPHSTAAHQNATTQGVEWASMRIDTQGGKWGEQMMQVLHDRVTLQAQQNLQEAKIRLDPPELGKLDLTVRVEGDRLNVQINTSTAATREALMQVSERLRAELQQQNFVHVDVNVGSEQQHQQQAQPSFEEESIIFASREFASSNSPTTLHHSEHWLNTQA